MVLISKEQIASLRDYRETLAREFAALEARLVASKQREARIEELTQLLENFGDSLDPAQAQKFSTAKAELEFLQGRESAFGEAEQRAVEEVRKVLRMFREIWVEALRTEFEAAIGRVTDALLPFYENPIRARTGAMSTDLVTFKIEGAFRGVQITQADSNPETGARNVLAMIDNVLNGNSPFPAVHPAYATRNSAKP